MGVHGLTTYLRANSNAIARTLQFTSNSNEPPTLFVVDGWSFIYETLALVGLPWVYGGEYRQFSLAVRSVVKAWLDVGLGLHFVFDGPFPELKFPTIITRMTENNIKPSLLFFRTSSVSRSKPKFLRESGMLPPRAYAACVQTLRELQQSLPSGDGLELHFADEEGDPYAVELAARLGGYVVGKDSDFVILNADGYQGYIPLDDMIWTSLVEEADSLSGDDWGNDEGFQTVVNSKSKRKAVAQQKFSVESGNGIMPPEDVSKDALQLSVTVYPPANLASHLEIPLSLLPLLAALVGNDFTGTRADVSSATTSQQTNLQWLFFDRRLTLAERILRVASTLRSILNAALTPSGKKSKNRERDRVSSVMELIDRAVTALIVRNVDSMASGEKDRVVERVVEATLQYAIPKWEGELGHLWSSDVCALHEPGACPLVLLRSLASPEEEQSVVSATPEPVEGAGSPTPVSDLDRVRALYVSAYRTGYLDPHTLDVLHSGTFWYRQFLENPDLEAVARTFARPIQLWTYAVLDEVIGIPRRAAIPEVLVKEDVKKEGDDESADKEDEDELIDVVEEADTEDEDPLAPLRGVLQQLNGSSTAVGTTEDSTSQEGHGLSGKRTTTKIVEEHIRRGTRLAAEDVEVLPLPELMAGNATLGVNGAAPDVPLVLHPPEERLAALLQAVGTPVDQVSTLKATLHELPPQQRVPLLTLRSILYRLHIRARESAGSRDREKERWTKQEAQAYLASFSWSTSASEQRDTASDDDDVEVEITDRNVQLTAQILATTDAIERLSECLLLSSPSTDNGEAALPSPALLFSGKTFHAYLTGAKPIPPRAVSALLWNAACMGLGDAFGEGVGKKRKKGKDSATGTGQTTPAMSPARGAGTKKSAVKAVGGKFGLLASLTMD